MTATLRKLSLTAALIFGMNASAGVLIEPYLGYHTGKAKQDTSSETVSGVTFGGRLGFQKLGFMGGVDYMTGKWSQSSTPKVDVTPSTLGLFVGYEFPVMLRVYGVYGLQVKSKGESNGGSSTYKGNGLKLGVGFTALPLVSINVEYMTSTFDEDDNGKMAHDLKSDMYGLTVSLPLDL